MIDTIDDVQPLDAFRDNPAQLLRQLKSTHRAITLTVDGEPAVILQDPAEYQRTLDRLDEVDAREGIRRGLADIEAGRIRPAREAFADLDREYGIQG